MFISLFSALQTFAVKKTTDSCFEHYACYRLGTPRKDLSAELALEKTHFGDSAGLTIRVEVYKKLFLPRKKEKEKRD